MHCPKCRSVMEPVTHGGIQVDRCTDCRGIWFDLLERERLTGLSGSEQIDSGDRTVGACYDSVERIDCPVCETPLIRMVDAVQRHVRFEACKTCNGVFLDAGEFTDYKHETLTDWFRSLIKGSR